MEITILGVDSGKVELVVNPQYVNVFMGKGSLRFIISCAYNLSCYSLRSSFLLSQFGHLLWLILAPQTAHIPSPKAFLICCFLFLTNTRIPKYVATAIIIAYTGARNGSRPSIKKKTPRISKISRFSNPKMFYEEKISINRYARLRVTELTVIF